MFLSEGQYEHSEAEWAVDCPETILAAESEMQTEKDAFEALLNTADAARAGLASDENDFDYTEEETI